MISISLFPTLAIKNRRLVEQSASAGCFHCCKVFAVNEITEYTDKNKTCLCPYCGVDSVVGEDPSFILDEAILKKAHQFWYVKR